MNAHFYVTAALPYVNAEPHLGHALGLVQADAIARHARSAGKLVRYVTGSDENSLKTVRAAELAGLAPTELVAKNSARFIELCRLLEVVHDDFVRTSVDPRHARTVARLWRACAERGDLYQRDYQGLYCVGCEDFLRERELDPAGLCPEHGRAPEPVSETNWFFRLSRYSDALWRLVSSGELSILPEERRHEVLAFIDSGLEDFSVSRSRVRARGWGLAVPDDPAQIVFVWFDALANYVSALGFAEGDPLYERFWASSPARVHVIGKGILRFHAVYWPAILLSAGLAPPTEVRVHGYLTAEGRKIGKSLGNGVDPFALLGELGAPALRHYLLRHLPTSKDADFSPERLRAARDTDLAHQLGNLVHRSLRLIERCSAGKLPEPGAWLDSERELDQAARAARAGVDSGFARFDLRAAADAAWSLIAEANRYVDRTAPWGLEAGSTRQATVLYRLADAVREIADLLGPFLPSTAGAIAARLGTSDLRRALAPGTRVSAGSPLFPRRD